MYYPQEFRKKVLEIQAREGLVDRKMAEMLTIPMSTVARWRRGFVPQSKALALEKLRQDFQVHLYSSPRGRADRLGVSISTIHKGSNRLSSLPNHSEQYHRVGNWLNKLPQQEQNEGRLFLSRVTQVCDQRLPVLDLSQLGLRTLPTGVLGWLSWLRALDLSGNFLTALDDSGIVELKELRYLDLGHNLLTDSAVGWLTQLTKLEYLHLNNNLFTNVSGLDWVRWLAQCNLADNPIVTDRIPSQHFPAPASAIHDPPGITPLYSQSCPVNGQPSNSNLTAATAGSTVGSEGWGQQFPEPIACIESWAPNPQPTIGTLQIRATP